MKLKQIFKATGVSLFLASLLFLFYATQNKNADLISVCVLVGFGSVLAFGLSCLITGELFGRIEDLETKVFYLEEELKKIKNRGNDNE